jgi:hypothetical protein
MYIENYKQEKIPSEKIKKIEELTAKCSFLKTLTELPLNVPVLFPIDEELLTQKKEDKFFLF